jgi:hypothetical protein
MTGMDANRIKRFIDDYFRRIGFVPQLLVVLERLKIGGRQFLLGFDERSPRAIRTFGSFVFGRFRPRLAIVGKTEKP